MIKLNPYLNFDGECEAAFNFYKGIFGGEFLGGMFKMGDAPGNDIPEEAKNRVMHVAINIGDNILMGSDTFPGQPFSKGTNNYINITPDSRQEADRLFNELSAGGVIEMPMEDQFWGDYFGSLIDKFGVCWMINYNQENKTKK